MAPPPDPNMKHVSSEAIDAIAKHLKANALDGDKGPIALAKKARAANASVTTFGAIGGPMLLGYNSFQDDIAEVLDTVKEVVENYIAQLEIARDTWIEAENQSKVQVEE